MKVAIRVDSSSLIGYGHVFRCLNLARKFQETKNSVHFYCESLEGNLIGYISKYFNVIVVESDADSFISNLFEKPDVIIIDSYRIDIEFEKKIKSIIESRLVVIDDIERSHECDLLIDQNYSVRKESYPYIDSNKKMLGIDYAMLNDDFSSLHNQARKRERIQQVLVFFGGGDISEESSKVLEALNRFNPLDIDFIFVSKSLFNYREKFTHFSNIKIYSFVENMAQIMSESDVMFGTCGTTNWERFCLGLPSYIVSVADNQLPNAIALSRDKLIKYIGLGFDTTVNDWENVLRNLKTNISEISAISEKTLKLVDGKGCERIVQRVKKLFQEED